MHSFTDFHARVTGVDTAEPKSFMFLYATSRRFEQWFEGDTPVTNPNLDEDQ